MSGMACLQSVCKLMNRVCRTSLKAQVNIAQNGGRHIGSSSIRNLKINPVNMDKAVEGNRKNWVSYGFCTENQYLDNHMMHLTLFVSISICLTLGSYVLIYLPDFRMKDWALREAYLELRRRENQGLPPIDPNLIDPSKIYIPTDEELQDTEIII